MRNAFINELSKLAKNNENIMLLTGDLGYGIFEDFEQKFPNQFINCGVAEQNMIGVAAGLASEAKRVFVYSIANFPTFRCLEQIRNDICYHGLPVTIVSIGSGFSYGTLGYSHYAIEDIAIMRCLPGLRIFSPVDPNSVIESLNLILQESSPAYIRLGKNGEENLKNYSTKNVEKLSVRIPGVENLVLSTGSISYEVEKAVEHIVKLTNIKICFATVTQLKPLNLDLSFIKQFHKIITIEEHTLSGGFGSIINDFVVRNALSCKLYNIGLEDKLHKTIGSLDYMRNINSLDYNSLLKTICSFIEDKKS